MSSLKHEPRNQNGILTLHPEKGEGISILSAALIAINILALLLRFWSRALSPERKPSSDDWLAAAALVNTYHQRTLHPFANSIPRVALRYIHPSPNLPPYAPWVWATRGRSPWNRAQ